MEYLQNILFSPATTTPVLKNARVRTIYSTYTLYWIASVTYNCNMNYILLILLVKITLWCVFYKILIKLIENLTPPPVGKSMVSCSLAPPGWWRQCRRYQIANKCNKCPKIGLVFVLFVPRLVGLKLQNSNLMKGGIILWPINIVHKN